MNVGVFTEYGPDIGYGHVSRSSSIAGVLADYGCNITYFIREAKVLEYDLGFETHLCEWSDGMVFESVSKEIDVFLVDSYRVSKVVLNTLFSGVARLFSIVDSKLNYPDFGTLIFPSVYANNYVLSNDLKVLSGADYLLFRPSFRNKKREFTINPLVQSISISLGGFLGSELLKKVVDSITFIFGADIQIHILGGNDTPCHSPSNVTFYGFVDVEKYIDILQSSDLVIANGGQTLNEALALNIPTIAVETASNQRENIRSWSLLNCCYPVLENKNSSFENDLKEGLKLFKGQSKREEFSHNTSKLIDFLGALRVSKYILYGTENN